MKLLNRLTIAKKFILIAALFSVFLLVLVIFISVFLGDSKKLSSEGEKIVRNRTDIFLLASGQIWLNVNLHDYLDFKDPKILSDIRTIQAAEKARLRQLKETVSIAESIRLLESYETGVPARDELIDRTVVAVNEGSEEKAEMLIKEIRRQIAQGGENLARMSESEAEAYRDIESRRTELRSRIRQSVLFFAGTALFLSVLLTLTIVRSVIFPIRRLTGIVKGISAGNLDAEIGVGSEDEVGRLASSFKDMSARLKEAYGWLEKRNAALSQKIEEIEEKRIELEKTKTAILNLLEDVNEEKEISRNRANELRKFQLAVENASDLIVITDAEGMVLYVNKAATGITGFPEKEMAGEKAGKPWGGLMDKEFYRRMWKTIKTDKVDFIGELTNKRKNGEEYTAEVRIAPITDKAGNVMFFVGIERDITKAKEIDRAKTEFVSLASHQLRTPLAAIKWYVERLLSKELGRYTKKQKQYLDEVYRSNQRMIALISALLNVSRIEMGTLAVEPRLVDFIRLIRGVLRELSPQIRKKALRIKKSYEKEMPFISVDPDLMRVVFQNLLSNAVKYTPRKGDIAIEIKIRTSDVFIKISDTGCGIPGAQQSKIFEKFFRGDNAKEIDPDGTGLGLYVAKAVVEQSGGKIWFESPISVKETPSGGKEERGTAFYVTIPLKGMEKKEGTKKLERV